MSELSTEVESGHMISRHRVDSIKGRQRDLAAIHIALKALRWSDDEYRDIMATVCGGIRSSGGLDFAGRMRFMAHLQACIRSYERPSAAPATRKPRRPLKPHESKMWSLWMQLADANLVESRTMKALTAFAKRQTKVDSIEWLNRQQQDLVIESLKRWLSRREEPGP